ncbi:type VI secretion system accessory protein TagJ [Roseomonas sp. CCTCC AB2023176]|uniref:type VI secretion system accessory protein TagJ n=1 Tax=Roseomonas sp. CCTCC AB2023176 TaxID=3342640 RepID=UPI0035DEE7F7
MRAIVLARAGDVAGAAAAAAEAESLRPRSPGTAELVNGKTIAFDDMRDADDLISPGMEVLTQAGDHMLVAFERVSSLSFAPGRRARDLVWRRAEITLKDGTEGLIFLPAVYPPVGGAMTDAARMGRVTEWHEETAGGATLVRGVGQRLYLLGEEAVTASELAFVKFD